MNLILPVGQSVPPVKVAGEHWYQRDGKPAYSQRTKAGGSRGTDIRDARRLGLVPSVTTVLKVLAKPALENWKVDQGILAALTLPIVPGESEEAYLERIKADSQAQAKAAAEEGDKIHDALELAFKGEAFPSKYSEHVRATREEIARLFPGVTDWRAEDYFASALGYGGKVDLHSPSTGIVCDYKGRDGDFTETEKYGKPKKLNWDQHWQLAAYQRGLRLPRNVCANIFVSRTHPGKVASHVWSADEIESGWQVFQAALQLWVALKKYNPAFALERAANADVEWHLTLERVEPEAARQEPPHV